MLGGGQLGRMLALAGYPLGFTFRFFDSARGAASQVAELVTGSFEDSRALDSFAAGLDVITYEFENVPVSSAAHLERAHKVYPPSRALAVAQNRIAEKKFLASLGINTALYREVASMEDVRSAARELGGPTLLKTVRHGYDGRGQALIADESSAPTAWNAVAVKEVILEALVPFDRELSLVAARGKDGAIVFYPLVENVHRDGILFSSVAPAPGVPDHVARRAHEFARTVLEELDYVGVLALELFQVGEELLVNELAPRVHNSGHWTIDGAVTSQFENHLRAIAGLPLGSAAAVGFSRMTNLLGAVPPLSELAAVPDAHIHLYGKSPRPRRKLGHITVCAPSERAANEAHHRVRSLVLGETAQQPAETGS